MQPSFPVPYCGPPPIPPEVLGSWNLDPVVLATIGALAASSVMVRRMTAERRWAMSGAAVVLAVAFVSPLCAMTTALFSARAIHHILLYAVAAPLLAMAMPLKSPLPRWATFLGSTVVLWAWHLPALYSVVLADTWVYWGFQGLLIATAWLFWSQLMDPDSPALSALPLIALGAGQMGLLAALLTFAPNPLYGEHLTTTMPFGLSALEDQQLAGLIMWVPGMAAFLVLAVWLGRRSWFQISTGPA